MMALAGLNMGWVLPMTVGVWPSVAGMGLGWYSIVSVALGTGAFGRWRRRGSHRPCWRVFRTWVMTRATPSRTSFGATSGR